MGQRPDLSSESRRGWRASRTTTIVFMIMTIQLLDDRKRGKREAKKMDNEILYNRLHSAQPRG